MMSAEQAGLEKEEFDPDFDKSGTESDMKLFLEELLKSNNSSGNKKLRDKLKWEEDRYWKVQGKLVEEGLISRGKGKGGSVSFVAAGSDDTTELAPKIQAKELELYPGALKVINSSWAKSETFDYWIAENTAQKGKKNTGGKWTRPDISLVGSKSYEYFPTLEFNIVTFEIKPSSSIDVTGVFEALSHREYATRSYVIYAIEEKTSFENYAEALRIIAIAEKYGVGIYTTAKIGNFDDWDLLVSAQTMPAHPANVDKFIRMNFSDENRTQIVKWQK